MILRQSKLGKEPGWTYHGYQLPSIMLLLLCGLGLTACQNQRVETSTIDIAIKKSIAYLHHEYNPTLGLIRESPKTAPNKHWLMTDNWLAATALSRVNDDEFATKIHNQLQQYGSLEHGLIEALLGADITWPLRTPSQVEIEPGIWLEIRNQQVMEDWHSYTDLALYRALDLYNEGRIAESRQQYETIIRQFRGVGFADQAIDGRYTTYKLALAIYVAGTIDAPIDPKIVTELLSKQDRDTGGFSTLYDEAGRQIGDSNTETTAYALLALSIVQSEY